MTLHVLIYYRYGFTAVTFLYSLPVSLFESLVAHLLLRFVLVDCVVLTGLTTADIPNNNWNILCAPRKTEKSVY